MSSTLKRWFNFKVILGAILFAVCIFGILLGILWSAKAKNIAQAPATAILNIIEAPTITPLMPATTSTPTSEPTSSQNVPPLSGVIAIGDYVEVTGTGGDGLRLHVTAGVSSKVNYIAIDGQVFLVKDGPKDADDYVWWLLQDPYNETANGWGVANYLKVIPNP